jgi:endonuclease/exonuclease/phosphatase family metal-dependent hydrolase
MLFMARQMVRAELNDNLSRSFAGMVPQEYRDTDQYLNIVQWNIEWFGAQKSKDKDKRRVEVVTDILEAFNADLFVFQEVAGPSQDGRYPGVFDSIATELGTRGAGDYVVYYTKAGGEQRVAMMWDRDFIRSKTDVTDLFPRGTHKTPDGKDAFATRTPLHGLFEARVGEAGRFDFQALGVHLKAMEDGKGQRESSAKVLAEWMIASRTETENFQALALRISMTNQTSPIYGLQTPRTSLFLVSI